MAVLSRLALALPGKQEAKRARSTPVRGPARGVATAARTHSGAGAGPVGREPQCRQTPGPQTGIAAPDDESDAFTLGGGAAEWAHVTMPATGMLRGCIARQAIDAQVRKAAQPLLLAKSVPKARYARILVPIDFSEAALAAARVALAASEGAQLVFLTAFTLFEDAALRTKPPRPAPTLADARERARARLARFVNQLDARNNLVSIVAWHGRLDTSTYAYAARMASDLAVVGHQPVSRLEALLLGSAEWKLNREIAADVLVVPAPVSAE